jgi:hypothetical protein
MNFPAAVPVNKTLLALLLALKDLETPLTKEEQEAFRNVADQLHLDPQGWEDYRLDLLTVIEANCSFNQLYQTALSQLDTLSDNIPCNLLPTDAELEKALTTAQAPVTRGFAPLSDDLESNEINNMVINVLASHNPTETTKKLSRFEQLQQFLQQNISQK